MTLNHINIFLKVYEHKNITHAAAALNMTQPAVSRAIKELEQYYGVYLFERLNKRLQVTEYGELFYTQALHIAHLLSDMDQSLKEHAVIRVGASITLGNVLLPDLIASFQKNFSNVQVQVVISNGKTLRDDLLANRLDLALVEGYLADPNLHCDFLSQDRLALVLPPNHTLAAQENVYLEELINYPLLLREEGSVSRLLVDHAFHRAHITATPLWQSASAQALINAVHLGVGISLLPEHIVQKAVSQGLVCTRPVSNENFLRNNHIVWHKHKLLTPILKSFIQESNRCATALYPDEGLFEQL